MFVLARNHQPKSYKSVDFILYNLSDYAPMKRETTMLFIRAQHHLIFNNIIIIILLFFFFELLRRRFYRSLLL